MDDKCNPIIMMNINTLSVYGFKSPQRFHANGLENILNFFAVQSNEEGLQVSIRENLNTLQVNKT